jgi:hypothetical protein
MSIDLRKLRRHTPELGTMPGHWMITTAQAARLLHEHRKTILSWHRAGIFCTPYPYKPSHKRAHTGADPGIYAFGVAHAKVAGNALWFRAGDVLAWWESKCTPATARSYDTIVADWLASSLGQIVLQAYPGLSGSISCGA